MRRMRCVRLSPVLSDRLKRCIDVVGSLMGLVLLAPVMAVVAVLVRRNLGPPVLFHQERAGLRGEPFRLHKFRSMTDSRGPDGELLPDSDRLPSFGQRLRSSSLDELPELWNVLLGDMSLVGPRPLPTAYLDRYRPEERRRHDVRPGITGWAQINGRNSVGWDERLDLDVWYVDNRSLALDVRILLRTVGSVLGRRGISEAGVLTMTELPTRRWDP